MRLEPIREQRTLRVASPSYALQAIGDHAARRGRVLSSAVPTGSSSAWLTVRVPDAARSSPPDVTRSRFR